MATDLGHVKSPPQPARHDAYVAGQLARAEKRIRGLDLAAGFLGLLALAAAYAVIMVLADRLLQQAPAFRQGAFLLFLAGAGAFTVAFLGRPLTRRVNPYFAAKQVEQTLPGAKNSVVNWLDARSQSLPAAILGAVGQRAAKDLARADLEQAVSGRRAGWAAGIAGLAGFLLFVAMIGVGGPRPFFSRLGHAFAPFGSATDGPATRLTLVRPRDGDAAAVLGQPFAFTVRVEGTVPDPRGSEAVRLLYRYQESEPYLERVFREEGDREWAVTLPPSDVRNGFWYKVVGGDAETAEYRVSVRTAPQVEDFRVTYRSPKYAALPVSTSRERKLKALRGSEAVLTVHTNRVVRDARLEFSGSGGVLPPLRGAPLADDPRSFRVTFALAESGLYRLGFTSDEGESFTEPGWQNVEVVADQAPSVELSTPGKDITLPADGILHLTGHAVDDLGVQSLVLRMRSAGQALEPRKYRSADKLRLADGGFPRRVEYRDDVDLAALCAADGAAFPLSADAGVEYWLEASDAREPQNNVGASKHFKVKIARPENDAAAKEKEKQRSQAERQEHEKRQDHEIQKENGQRKEERQQAEEAAGREDQERKQQAGRSGNPSKPDNGAAGNPNDPNNDTKTGTGDKPGESGDAGTQNGAKPTDQQRGQPKDDPAAGDGQQLKDEIQRMLDESRGQKSPPKAGNAERTPGDKNTGHKEEDSGSKPDSKPGTADQRPGDPKRDTGTPNGSGREGTASNAAEKSDGTKPEKPDGPSNPAANGGEKPDNPRANEGTAKEPKVGTGRQGNEEKNGGSNEKPGTDNRSNSAGNAGEKQPDKKQPGAAGKAGTEGDKPSPQAVPDNRQQPGDAGNEKPAGKPDGNDNKPGKEAGNQKNASPQPAKGGGENNSTGKPNGDGANKPDAGQKSPKGGNEGTGANPSGTDPTGTGNEPNKGGTPSNPSGEGAKPGAADGATGPMNGGANKPGEGGTKGTNDKPGSKDGSGGSKPDNGKPDAAAGSTAKGNEKPDDKNSPGGQGKPNGGVPGTKEKGTAGTDKANGMQDANGGEPQPGSPKNGPHGASKKDFKQATAEDIAKAAGRLQSKDANEARQGMKDLDQILNEAKNDGVRKAAAKALQEANAKRQNQQGEGGKPPEKTTAGADQPGKPAPGKGPREGPGDAQPGGERGGRPKHSDQGTGPGKGPGEGAEAGPQDAKPPEAEGGTSPGGKTDGQGTGTGKPTTGGEGEGTGKKDGNEPGKDNAPGTGGANQTGRNPNGAGSAEGGPALPAKPEAGLHHESGELKLQDWRKTLEELRKSGKYSDAQLNDLGTRLEKWESGRKARPPETPVDPRTGGPLPSTGNRVRSTGTEGKPGDLKAGAAPLPPAAYRDAYRQFNKPKAESAEPK